MFTLAIDQGTTNTKALVFDEHGQIAKSASASCTTQYPYPGWAEQSADDIWKTTQSVVAEACAGIERDVVAIGIANQRETLVVWDADTGEPVGPAPIWQCRRTSEACARLVAAGYASDVSALTGLGINPLFPASKLAWVLQHRPEAQTLHKAGRFRAGTVDSWVLWNLTGGEVFATDHSNASRTLLFDTDALAWSPKLADIFDVPLDCLATPKPSDSNFGKTARAATSLPEGVPIHAMLGDSHAALFGHGIREPGKVKATFGTGSSLITLTDGRVASRSGLSGTIAWTSGGSTVYGLEGNITVSAQSATFMADMMGITNADQLSHLAQQVDDTGGVSFVPALAGLGAPHWDDSARGLVCGLSLATRPPHLARATFEAIAHQVADVLDAIEADLGHPLDSLSVDGGASANSFLMQLQADLIGKAVERRAIPEIGALGVALMASEGLGTPLSIAPQNVEVFQADTDVAFRKAARSRWREAVARARR